MLVGSFEQADALAGPRGLSGAARRLVEVFWPGALTVVVPRRPRVDWALGAHADTIGLRLPDHVVVRALCAEVGALATTSANRHGDEPCVDAEDVAAIFGSRVTVVDGGRCSGTPSTVVSVFDDGVRCLREGAVAWADVASVAGVA